MRKIFIILLFIPLVYYAQVVCAVVFNYGTTAKVSPTSTLNQKNISNINKQAQNYNISPTENNTSSAQEQTYIFTKEEANKLFQSPVPNSNLSGYQKTKQKDDFKKKNPDWWRQESNLNGWGMYFFDY